MKLESSKHILEKKILNIKFHQYLPSGSWVVPCGQMDGQTDMTKIIVAFRNYANAPNNTNLQVHVQLEDGILILILIPIIPFGVASTDHPTTFSHYETSELPTCTVTMWTLSFCDFSTNAVLHYSFLVVTSCSLKGIDVSEQSANTS